MARFYADEQFPFPVVESSRRDVPAERLYKIARVAQNGGIKPGFGISGAKSLQT